MSNLAVIIAAALLFAGLVLPPLFLRSSLRHQAEHDRLPVEERFRWTATDYLLANIIDTLQVANWQRAGDPNTPMPLPTLRPNDAPDDEPVNIRVRPLPARR